MVVLLLSGGKAVVLASGGGHLQCVQVLLGQSASTSVEYKVSPYIGEIEKHSQCRRAQGWCSVQSMINCPNISVLKCMWFVFRLPVWIVACLVGHMVCM